MSSLALSSRGVTDQVHQHIGEAVTSHRAVGAALHFEIEKYTAVAAENGDVAHRAITLERPQGRYFFQAGPVLMLEHCAGGVLHDDAANHCRSHHYAKS